MAVELVNGFDAAQVECSLCATRVGGELQESLASHVEYCCLRRKGQWQLAPFRAFSELTKRKRIDIVHSHGRGSAQFVAASLTLGRSAARHIFHDHYGLIEDNQSASLPLRISAGAGCHAYIGVDEQLCEWARTKLRLPPERVYLVRNGFDARRFADVEALDIRREFRLSADSLILVMVAQFRPQKDHPTLFQALSRCSALPRLRVLLVGQVFEAFRDYSRQCSMLERQLGLGSTLIRTGPRTDVPQIIKGADLGVLSSRSETGPLALLEYMAGGIPYVVTATGQVTRMVEGAGVGITVSPGDPAALAAAIDRMCELSAEERRRTGLRGRQIAEAEFSQQHTVARLVEIYRRYVPGPNLATGAKR